MLRPVSFSYGIGRPFNDTLYTSAPDWSPWEQVQMTEAKPGNNSEQPIYRTNTSQDDVELICADAFTSANLTRPHLCSYGVIDVQACSKQQKLPTYVLLSFAI